jgi:hypothetical protein
VTIVVAFSLMMALATAADDHGIPYLQVRRDQLIP